MGGVEAIQRLRRLCPSTAIVVVSAFSSPARVAAAYRAGAVGYVAKTRPVAELVNHVRLAADGELVWPAPEMAATLELLEKPDSQYGATQPVALSARELEILQLILGWKEDERDRRGTLHQPLDGPSPREEHPS